MSDCRPHFSLVPIVALVLGLTAISTAQAAGPNAPKTPAVIATPTPTPTPSPKPSPLPPSAVLCNLNTCISVCQMNNPERGVKETCAPSCTALIENRKRDGVCKR